MATLYRHYRPQRFSDVTGQDHVTRVLQQAFIRDRLAHAYLFYGPRGTGKTTTARIVAKRANCSKPKKGEPCLKCDSCRALAEGRHLDVLEIDAASNRGIDDIRALRETVNTAPTLGTYKVYIIDEVHMLTNEAAAALLKTLEEPARHVLFILATTELHKVLPTILSRCQVFRFRRATADELRKRLQYLLAQEKRSADDAALDFIIARSDGCYRDAESLLGQLLMLHDDTITHDELVEFLGLPPRTLVDDFLAALVRGESAPALSAVDTSFASGFDPEQFLKESIHVARDGALALAQASKGLPSFAQESDAAQRLPAIIRALLQALQDLAYVPQPTIALHLAILTVCTSKGIAPATPVPQSAAPAKKQKNVPATSSDAQPVTPAPAVRVSSSDAAASVQVAQVTAVWNTLIDRVREKNPVAATFLRALEPQTVVGTTVHLRAQYALHRNFFTKPENKAMLHDILAELLGTPVTIQCDLDASAQPAASAPAAAPGKHDEVFQNVQEVFGAAEAKG